jgi:hypothetical protein
VLSFRGKHLGGRTGSVFDDRYHVEVLTNPRKVRNTLCYVMNYAHRHGIHRHRPRGWVHPCSSARYFDGWDQDISLPPLEPGADKPVADAKTWLLTSGWRRWGPIGVDEVPTAGRR